MPRWRMVKTELVRKKQTVKVNELTEIWITIIALQEESSSEPESVVSWLNSVPTFLQRADIYFPDCNIGDLLAEEILK